MPDTQEQLLTEITSLGPTDFVRVVNDPTTTPDSAVIQKSKFVDNLFGDVITPVTNGATPDWAPTGIATAHIIRILPSGPTSISGMTTGALGRVLFLQNVGSSLVTLLDESTLSSAVNRFQLPGTASDFVILPEAAVIALYDTTSSRWKIISANTYNDGWTPLGAFFTFVSTDGATTNVTVAADITSRVQKGTKVRYLQSQPLTASWNMDANSLSQVGSFPGTDTAMTYTAGKFSNAATFNGTTSKIVLTDTASLKPTGEFTVGAWIKTSVVGTAKFIFQSYSANTFIAGFQLMINTSNVLRVLLGKNTGTAVGADYVEFSGTTNVCDNNWHYVVLSFRNNYVQLYLNGNLEVGGFSYAPAYAATNYIRIGCGNASGTDVSLFSGQIDDVFFINGYALDEVTIRNKYIAQTAQGTGSVAVTKCGIVTDIGVYNGTLTPLTFWGGTDFSSISGTFGTPYISNAKAPFGFNPSPKKWFVTVVYLPNALQTNPVSMTIYNLGGIQLSMPIGAWIAKTYATMYLDRGTAATMAGVFGLSASLSAVSDVTLTGEWAIGSISLLQQPVYIESAPINVSVKTLFYFIGQTSTTTVVNMISKNVTIQFICAYI